MDTQLQIEVLAKQSRWNVEQVGRDFATLVRYAFAVLFVVTGVAKLASGEAFVEAVAGYGLVPTATVDLVASAAIVGEVALGVWLASGRGRRAALGTAAGCFVAFAGVIALAWWRGAAGDCGCFSGVVESQIGLGAVLRNAALAAVAVNAAVVERPRSSFIHKYR
jgi:uncharacterized membrane protein YphA (DoxX/SURF4 family)